MSTLIERLNAAIDEDERVAQWAMQVTLHGATWRYDPNRTEDDGDDPILHIGDLRFYTESLAPGQHPGQLEGLLRPSHAQHIARHDPGRVLDRAKAARELLAQHDIEEVETVAGIQYSCGTCHSDYEWFPEPCCPTLAALARMYQIGQESQ